MVDDMYLLVEKLTGSSMILWGAAVLANPNIILSLYKTFTKKEENETLIYITAGMFLTFGLIIVWTHNEWYLTPSLLVTLIGWILVFKAMLWILFPSFLIKFTKKFFPLISNKWFTVIYSLLLIGLGLFILFTEKLFSSSI